jgi:hypothetical protein
MSVTRRGASQPARRWTACGAPELEERVGHDLGACVERVVGVLPRDALAGVALGGTYARGEGGAYWRGETLLPFDDYDLWLLTAPLARAASARLVGELRPLAVELSGRVGVRVMLRHLDRPTLLRPPPTLRMADLRAGHRVLHGPAEILRGMPGPDGSKLPPIEATRLVLDGLTRRTRARAQLERTGEPNVALRVTREVRFAWLAAGDGWLVATRAWHASPVERLARVWRDAPHPDVRDGYCATGRAVLEGAPPIAAAELGDAVAAAGTALARVLADVERIRLGAPDGDAVGPEDPEEALLRP